MFKNLRNIQQNVECRNQEIISSEHIGDIFEKYFLSISNMKKWQIFKLFFIKVKILIQMLIIKSKELYLSLLLFKLSGVQNRPRVSTKKIFQKTRKCEIGIIINRVAK